QGLEMREKLFVDSLVRLAPYRGEFRVREVNQAPRCLEAPFVRALKQPLEFYSVSWKGLQQESKPLLFPYFVYSANQCRWYAMLPDLVEIPVSSYEYHSAHDGTPRLFQNPWVMPRGRSPIRVVECSALPRPENRDGSYNVGQPGIGVPTCTYC